MLKESLHKADLSFSSFLEGVCSDERETSRKMG